MGGDTSLSQLPDAVCPSIYAFCSPAHYASWAMGRILVWVVFSACAAGWTAAAGGPAASGSPADVPVLTGDRAADPVAEACTPPAITVEHAIQEPERMYPEWHLPRQRPCSSRPVDVAQAPGLATSGLSSALETPRRTSHETVSPQDAAGSAGLGVSTDGPVDTSRSTDGADGVGGDTSCPVQYITAAGCATPSAGPSGTCCSVNAVSSNGGRDKAASGLCSLALGFSTEAYLPPEGSPPVEGPYGEADLPPEGLEAEVDLPPEGPQGEAQELAAILSAMSDARPPGNSAVQEVGSRQQTQLTPTFATIATPMLGTNTLHEIDQAAQDIILAICDAQALAVGGAPGIVRFAGPGLQPLHMDQPVTLAELRRHKRAFLKLATKILFARLQDGATASRLFIDYLRDNVAGARAAAPG